MEFVAHGYPETLADLGEVQLNHAVAGDRSSPALLLLPPQTQSWWTYEAAMARLAERFCVYAVDLRGQGRSTRTPGRYTLDNMGNDLVRFIDRTIGRPVAVSGNSSGGVLAAWLAAYAAPGQVRGVVCEDPPFFASEANPACGHSIRQSLGPVFGIFHKYLGDQWSIGDWDGLQRAIPRELPPYVLRAMQAMRLGGPPTDGPPQAMREYDPEWGGAFWTGSVSAGCDHARMFAAARVGMLVTHHYRELDPDTGSLMGAVSDAQVARAGELVRAAGQSYEVVDLPDAPHLLHAHDPERYAQIVGDWAAALPGP